jgi:hypothetical protein
MWKTVEISADSKSAVGHGYFLCRQTQNPLVREVISRWPRLFFRRVQDNLSQKSRGPSKNLKNRPITGMCFSSIPGTKNAITNF